MLAAGSVDAVFCEPKPVDGHFAEDVRIHDLGHILRPDSSIPNRIGIDDHGGAVFALLEAARSIGPDPGARHPALSQNPLKGFVQLSLAFGVAAPAGIARRSLISAYENVLLELRHPSNVQQNRRSAQAGAG